ncbi:MAG: toll/interleukin-1 receptor domain-containing protein [Terriglobales bacterium]
MAFSIFLSSSVDPEEQALVWRIQTLAAAQGIQVFVPPRNSLSDFARTPVLLSEELRKAIDASDCVLAILTRGTGPAVQNELNYALKKRKLIIPIVEEGVGDENFFRKFQRVFHFSRWEANLGRVDTEISGFLLQQKLDKDLRQGLGVLAAIGIGLFLLAGLSKKS